MAPRFTILLPTHNRADLLRLAISSVLSQTESRFELFIVGDGCTDNSGEVVAGFNDARLRWFDLPKADGFGYANRNIALKHAGGEYVAFVADDDLVFPDHLTLLAATLEQSGAEWAYCRPLWVTTDGIVVPFASNLLNADELETFLTVGNHIPASCVLYRRRCLDLYGYWPEDIASAGDWHYWTRIIEGGNRANLAYSPIPSVLHFNARWKTDDSQLMGEVKAAREIARRGSWWPASLRVPIADGDPEQRVFLDLIGRPGYIDELRRDVARVVERLAWMQLCDTPALTWRLLKEIEQAGADLERTTRELISSQDRTTATQTQLNAVLASTSWRMTSVLRAVSRAIRRRER